MDKRQERPFDAADLLAWHLNRLYLDTLNRGGTVEQNMRSDYRTLMAGQKDRYTAYMLRRDKLKQFFAVHKTPPRQSERAG